MTVLELVYHLGCILKKTAAHRNQKRLPRRVISIGNMTVGGTGKTPAAIALAREAMRRGFKPCILTRGYKGKARGPCLVSMGKGPLMDAKLAGDEAVLMAEKLVGASVVKGGNRYESGMFALNHMDPEHRPDLFILDDGFQHWSLFRDKNILLIDSANPFGNRRLIPLGTLREPLQEMKRADVIVLTKRASDSSPQAQDALMNEIRRHNEHASLFVAAHRPVAFRTLHGESFPLNWAENRTFFGFCGIGNPQSFRQTFLSVDAKKELKGIISFRDHHRYTQQDIQTVTRNAGRTGAEWIVTTEKDIMRLRGLDLPEQIVSLSIEFITDGKFYDEVLRGLYSNSADA